jgi:hypothetical protein
MKRNIIWIVVVVVVAVLAYFAGRCPCCEKPKCEKVTLTFPGAEKHEVSLAEAKQYIQNYRKSVEAPKPKVPPTKAGSFEKGAVDKILAQPGCTQLRIYYGLNEEGKPNLVLVGVDSAGKDMTKACIMERGTLCPPFCDSQSELF